MVRGRIVLLVALSALALAAHVGDSRAEEAGVPPVPPAPAPAPAPAATWSVEDPGGPYRDLAFEASEGTWMSVDCRASDGRLVFDLLGDIWSMPSTGGEATLLSGGLSWEIQPRWSPDGKTILFTSDRGGGDNLWTMDADGGNRRALTTEKFRLVNNGTWHPSGRWVVGRKHFTSRRSLGAGEMWTYPFPDGGEGVGLTRRKNDQQDAGEPVFSPDARHLYWSEDMSGGSTFEYNKDPSGGIYALRRLDLETGEVRDVVERPGGAVRPQPSPDGRSMAFVRRDRGRSVLALLDVGTGAVRDLWDGLSLDQQETWAVFGPYPGFSWTGDGSALVIWARGGLHRVDAKDGSVTPVPFRCAVRQRLCETVRPRLDLGGPTFDVKVVRWPSVAADGSTAVFQALGRLWRRSGDAAPQAIGGAGASLEYAPRLTDDGKRIVYTTWDDAAGGTIRICRVDGSEARVLVATPGHYLSADLSPDGTRVVYHRGGADTYRGAAFSAEPGIHVSSVDGSSPSVLVSREGSRPRWSSDGKRILFHSREGEKAALVSVDVQGGRRRVHFLSERAVDFALSPDGRWIAWEELWQTYLAPVAPGPGAVELAPGAKNFPVMRLSRDAGTWLSWSPDSSTVRWSLGPDLFEADPAEVLRKHRERAAAGAAAPVAAHRGFPCARSRRLGWTAPADMPETDLWLVGGTVVPMHDDTVLRDGVVHVVGNRIAAIGTRESLPVPGGATVVDITGTTVLPGLVDVHSHTGGSAGGVQPGSNWAFRAMLAFGVTTSHDPSNETQGIHAESERVKAGLLFGPRILSTGTILYGAEGDFKAVVDSREDAVEAVRRTAAWGAISVKSYQQPRREQRQQVVSAAREVGVAVVPEGGSTLHHNLNQILDGHTTIEHALPVAPLFEPELRLFVASGTAYTPTLVVGYGGLWGENWWYAHTRVWENERLLAFVPRSVVDPSARRRVLATDPSDYHHFRLAATAAELVRRGGVVEIGAHGQMQGLGAHWETWMLAQGGLTSHEALRCATWNGARALGLDHVLGSLQPGLLADLIVIEGDPLEDIRLSERVRFTMVNGRLYDAATLEQRFPIRNAAPKPPILDPQPAREGSLCGPGACGCGG